MRHAVWFVGLATTSLLAAQLGCGSTVEFTVPMDNVSDANTQLETNVRPESDAATDGLDSTVVFDVAQNNDARIDGTFDTRLPPACGDKTVDKGEEYNEECDDGNTLPGDGCSGACTIEPNYTCPNPGQLCISTVKCNDGVVSGGEVCDDGNNITGDGCAGDCSAIEPWYVCPTPGVLCTNTVVCGDGAIMGTEVCDDGDQDSDDGCRGDCRAIEPGYVCPTPGSDCVKPVICNDGVVGQGEACDDGNNVSGDGCSGDCSGIEYGYLCPIPGQLCESQIHCGDGKVMGTEQCDDHNQFPADGCDDTCHLEPGWRCPVPGTKCEAARCGDSIIAGKEECDDNNSNANDGCSATCKVEHGWYCSGVGAGSCHRAVCNNGMVEGDEPCDDGNNVIGDGCNPFCEVEPQCPQGPGACNSRCGDGMMLAGDLEECDDGNLKNGDGCSSSCHVEDGWTCVSQPSQLGATLSVPVTFRDMISLVAGGSTKHPDFETFSGSGTLNLVTAILGTDGKPVYNNQCDDTHYNPTDCPDGRQLTTSANFAQWYHPSSVSVTVVSHLVLDRQPDGSYYFPSSQFFPLDGVAGTWVGQGLEATSTPAGGTPHNFGFTSEVRYWFQYDSATVPTLTFSGDDDVWVFINRHLAVDLGGLHPPKSGSVTITSALASTLGLVSGRLHEIALFHAERHTDGSNFNLTLAGFTTSKSVCASNCGDGRVVGDEVCDDPPNNGAYGGCMPGCRARGPFCGDHSVQTPPEACDDGANLTVYSTTGVPGCAPGCVWGNFCGDSNVDVSFLEQCDDATNTGEYGHCAPHCLRGPRCGDGIPQAPYEQCDEGTNTGTYNHCAPGCIPGPRCGDGVVQAIYEQCDDGQNTGGYGKCLAACRLGPRCGDTVVQTADGEQCDDGQNTGGYGKCAPGCKYGTHCGDGIRQQPQEQCDDGVNSGAYGKCAAGCRLGPRCGDGIRQQPQEECDDANTVSGDGCNAQCKAEIQH